MSRKRATTSPGRAPVTEAFERIGGVTAFARWAGEHPEDFYRLFARLIPLAGQGGEADALKVEIVRFSDPDEADADDPAA